LYPLRILRNMGPDGWMTAWEWRIHAEKTGGHAPQTLNKCSATTPSRLVRRTPTPYSHFHLDAFASLPLLAHGSVEQSPPTDNFLATGLLFRPKLRWPLNPNNCRYAQYSPTHKCTDRARNIEHTRQRVILEDARRLNAPATMNYR